MQTEGKINISELKPHPRNNEFFDDITGDKWEELLDSIRKRVSEGKRGNIEPIVITQDKTIVSGHQRVRAFKELGIDTIDAEVKIYDSEDEILLDLLESNIRRRGDVGGSAKKVGLRIKELERLYGIREGSANEKGNNRIGEPNNSADQKTQADLAAQMGISVDTLQNYKLLTEMIPELEELVDTGIVTKTTALAIMKELSSQEQEEMIASMDTTKKITQKQVQAYIDENAALKRKLIAAEAAPVRVVDNTEKIKQLENELDAMSQERTKLSKMLIEKQALLSQAMGINTNYQLVSHCSEITLQMLNFVKEMAKYDYMAESFNEIPIASRTEYRRCVNAVKKWADRILDVIDKEENIIGYAYEKLSSERNV